MRPSKTTKKIAVWMKSPAGVGHPPLANVIIDPRSIWVTLKVSGLAIKKKTKAE
jgi:hypothetical protein